MSLPAPTPSAAPSAALTPAWRNLPVIVEVLMAEGVDPEDVVAAALSVLFAPEN